MAASGATYFATQGHAQGPSAGVSQGIYESGTTQEGPLGARMEFADGRVFRYCYFSGAVAAGKLAAVDTTSQICAEAAATALKSSSGGASQDHASSAGVDVIYLVDSDIFTAAHSDGVFNDGFLFDHTDGYMYKIRKNTYTAATSVVTLTLYDTIVNNIDSEHEMSVIGSRYNNLVIAANAADAYLAGVSVVAQAASDFGWVQTWGPCCILCDGATTVSHGTLMTLSDDDDGGVQTFGGQTIDSEDDLDLGLATEDIVGMAISAGTDGKFFPIYLRISP